MKAGMWFKHEIGRARGRLRVLVVVAGMVAVLAAISAPSASAAPATASANATVAVAAHPTKAARAKGNWTFWGYRTNSWQTWAVATQSPTYIKFNVIPGFSQYVYVQAWIWKITAQNARSMGQCLGIAWSGSGLIVGCSGS